VRRRGVALAALFLVVVVALALAGEFLVEPIVQVCGGAESIAPDGRVVCVQPDLTGASKDALPPVEPPGLPVVPATVLDLGLSDSSAVSIGGRTVPEDDALEPAVDHLLDE
jgi:hypothetical protein